MTNFLSGKVERNINLITYIFDIDNIVIFINNG